MNSQAARNLSNRLPFSRALHFAVASLARHRFGNGHCKYFDCVTSCKNAVAAALRATPAVRSCLWRWPRVPSRICF
jgi:hypothetical protein